MPCQMELTVKTITENTDLLANVSTDCEIVIEITDTPIPPWAGIDDNAGIGDTGVAWSADKSVKELADKVDKVAGYSLVDDAEIGKLSTVEEFAQKNTVNSVAGKQGDVLLDKSDVGLSTVDNTADMDKPVSTAVAAALADKIDKEAGMGLSELNFTTVEKLSLDQSEQDRHTHNNKPVIDGLSDDAGVLQYKGLPISDQVALDAKVDKVAGYSLVDDAEIAKLATVQENATANRDDALNADKVHTHVISDVTGLDTALETKVDKVEGKQLSDENYTLDEKDKLGGIAEQATKNRVDSANADKVHEHVITDVTELDAILLTKFDKADIAQVMGSAVDKVMSQKAVTENINRIYRVLGGYVPFTGVYGLAYNEVSDTYERTGSQNFTAIQSLMKRCLLLPDGAVDYFLSAENSNYKVDGSPANITGANGYLGNVMVQVPKFYRKITTVGEVVTHEVSFTPEAGFTLHPAFIKAGVEVDYRYYRAYQGVEIDGKLRSVSGAIPTRSKNIGQFRALAKANGPDWHQNDWMLLDAIRELSSIEIGTFRSQDVLGQGNSTGANYELASGMSNSIGNGSSTSATSGWMSYRGIENFYASIWEFIDGINIRDHEPFVNANHQTFASNVFTGDYETTGVTQPTANGYISAMHHTDKGFFVKAVAGSSTTFFADYYYQAAGNRIWLHGGSADRAAGCGSFYSSAYYSSSSANATFGAGIAF